DDEDYRAAGHSFYTVETHVNYLREVAGDDSLRFTTLVVGLDDKRLHIYHEMFDDATGDLVATTEQMLLHMDTAAGRPAPVRGRPARALQAIRRAHAAPEKPRYLGRVMKTRETS
ncbi:MAG: thioesterase family protein, partial [bacterium]|nr:thioesterase family protein [bacterium]